MLIFLLLSLVGVSCPPPQTFSHGFSAIWKPSSPLLPFLRLFFAFLFFVFCSLFEKALIKHRENSKDALNFGNQTVIETYIRQYIKQKTY